MEALAKVRNLRSRVPLFLVFATTGALIFLVAGLLWSDYREQLRNAESITRHLAALAASQLETRIRQIEAGLLAISSEIPKTALATGETGRHRDRIGSLLTAHLAELVGARGLHICNADGVVVYSSNAETGGTVSVAERHYFQQLREAPLPQTVFSPVLKGRFSGAEVMVAARGLRDENGAFLGVVFGALDITDWQRQLADTVVEKRAAVVLKRTDNHAPVLLQRGESRGGYEEFGSAKRFVESVATLTKVGGGDQAAESTYPFYIVAGLNRHDVLGGWLARVSLSSGVVLVVVFLACGLVARLRCMRQREVSILGDVVLSELQFSDLAKLVPVGICRLDASGRCIFANDCLATMLGCTSRDLIGREWSAIASKDPRGTEDVESPGESVVPGVSEYKLHGPNGASFHVIGESRVECGADGTARGYVVALTDISRQKRAEAELSRAKFEAEQANKAKARFLAVASHDLRQPIQAINLFKDALIRAGLTREQENIARLLSQSVASLSELLYSLLDFSKLDAGMVQPQKRPVAIEQIFRSVDDAFSSIAQQRALRFKFFYPFKELVVFTDPGLLLGILRNLIDNAFKYTKSGGVLVGVREREGRFVIQVWDTGIGLPEGVGEQIFEECFQLGNPSRDRARGIGIGLSIARRTARLLGGDILYRSREGRGSVFEISLPSSVIVDGVRGAESLVDAKGDENATVSDYSIFSGWRIVVVEDDPVVAKSIELSLQALNMEVDVFCSAEEAIASPRLLGGDFYISDYLLPGENGIRLLEVIQNRSSSPIRAILMTGATSPDRQKAIRSQRWRVLYKPADLSLILSIMNDVVRAEALQNSGAAA